MRIVITGASGQIGTNLSLRCLKEGHAVFGLDLRPNSWTSEIPQDQLDLTRPTVIGALAQRLAAWGRPDIVVHLAGHAKVHQLMQEPNKALENVSMTQHVLEFCRKAGAPLLFASSREVYGDSQTQQARKEEEAVITGVTSTYAASKLACEALIHAYARSYGLTYLIFRLSNVYGRYDNDLDRMERVIPLFMSQIIRGETITLFEGGKILDFTYIDDCVDGLLLGIKKMSTGNLRNETINLARGEGRELRELPNLLAAAMGLEANSREEPKRTGEISHYVACLDKARGLLGFAPRVSLPEGIRRAVTWGMAQNCPASHRVAKSRLSVSL